jgi:hypothetical protein
MALLTRRRIFAASRPRGYILVCDFLDEFENGTIPKTEATQKLSKLFAKLLDAPDGDALRILGLVRGRGEHFVSAAERERREGPIWNFIAKHMDAQRPEDPRPPRGVLSSAIKAACEKFDKDARTIQRVWGHYAYLYAFNRENRWALALVKRYVTKEEWEAGKNGPINPLVRIALQRQRAEKATRK